MILDQRWVELPNGNYILEKYICDDLGTDDLGFTVVNMNGSWKPVTNVSGQVIEFKPPHI